MFDDGGGSMNSPFAALDALSFLIKRANHIKVMQKQREIIIKPPERDWSLVM